MANEIKYVSLSNLDYYDGKIKEHIADADATLKENLEGQVTIVANAVDAEVTRAKAAEATNAAAAQAAQTDVDNLEAYVGTFTASEGVDTVVKYIDAKTANIASDEALGALTTRVTQAEKDIDNIEKDYLKAADKTELQNNLDGVAEDVAAIAKDYLKATDKTELEGKINAKADQTALDEVAATANAAATQTALTEEVNRAKGEEARIEGLVTAEAERAAGVESGLEDRIETMESFWAAAQADGTDSNVIDTLKEIQDYISSDETGASEMLAAIEANEKAIEDMDAAYKAADQTLQGNIDKKAESSAVEAIDGRVGALETASATHALKTEVEAVSDALDEYKNAHTGDYTNAQIDAAIKVVADDVAALGDTYATDDELAQAIADAKTDASNKDAVVLAEAQKGTTAVQTALDTHTGNGDIHVTTADKTKWNAALQAADVTVGSANGTIAVKGTDVSVKGLGSAAYTEAGAYDVSGAAAAVDGKLSTEVQRAKDAEAALGARIDEFVECSETEIAALFQK